MEVETTVTVECVCPECGCNFTQEAIVAIDVSDDLYLLDYDDEPRWDEDS